MVQVIRNNLTGVPIGIHGHRGGGHDELVLKLFWPSVAVSPWVRDSGRVDTEHSGSSGSCVDGSFEASERAMQSFRAPPGLV